MGERIGQRILRFLSLAGRIPAISHRRQCSVCLGTAGTQLLAALA
jgi:hypothetical protein